jgi:hypothetical protein
MEGSICGWNMWISFLLMLVLWGCRGEEVMPAQTHQGLNTLGYYVSDNEFYGGKIREGNILWVDSLNALEVYYYSETPHGFEENELWMWLKDDEEEWKMDSVQYRGDFTKTMQLDAAADNVFNVNFHDSTKRIIAGTFHLNFASIFSDTGFDGTIYVDTISYATLSRGRFDIRY